MSDENLPHVNVIARGNVLGLVWGETASVPANDYVEMLVNAGKLELLDDHSEPEVVPVLVPVEDAPVVEDEPKPHRARKKIVVEPDPTGDWHEKNDEGSDG